MSPPRARKASQGPRPRAPFGRTSSGRMFLIVTEGAVTEPGYFKALKDKYKLSNVHIHHPTGTDPLSLTEAAIKRQREEAQLAKVDNRNRAAPITSARRTLRL